MSIELACACLNNFKGRPSSVECWHEGKWLHWKCVLHGRNLSGSIPASVENLGATVFITALKESLDDQELSLVDE